MNKVIYTLVRFDEAIPNDAEKGIYTTANIHHNTNQVKAAKHNINGKDYLILEKILSE